MVVIVSVAMLCNDHAYVMLCLLFISPEIIRAVFVAMAAVLSMAIVVVVLWLRLKLQLFVWLLLGLRLQL